MAEEFNWTWQPKQVQFITAPTRFSAYVGGHGSGKTSAFCRRTIAIATKYPDSRILLCRYTYPEVNNTLVPQFMDFLPAGLIHKWRRSEGVLELYTQDASGGAYKGPGISTILFRNLDDPKKFRSENINAFGISQADDLGIGIDHWTELTGRLRRKNGRFGPIGKQYGYLEGNYRGRNWIWQTFHPEGQAQSGRLENKDFRPADYFLIEGSTTDNAANLPEEYLRDMNAMPEEWKKRYMTGSWDEVGGLVYDEFGPNHLSEKVFVNGKWQYEIPSNWYRYRAIDHGMRNPTAAVFVAVSPSGTFYIYDEYYRPGLAQVHAENISKMHPTDRFVYTLIDPSAFNKDSTSGESPAHQYYDKGVNVVKAPSNAVSGVVVVKKYLQQIDAETGKPRILINPARCPNLVREMKQYIWDEVSPSRRAVRNEPEKPRKLNDHILDALKYLIVSSPPPTPMPKIPDSRAVMTAKKQYETLWEV